MVYVHKTKIRGVVKSLRCIVGSDSDPHMCDDGIIIKLTDSMQADEYIFFKKI